MAATNSHSGSGDVGIWLTDDERALLTAVMDHLIPGDDISPGAGEAGGAEYVDRLLGAFTFDPPRIFAGGPFAEHFDDWIELGAIDELAWRIRIEGTLGHPEREFNGTAEGWQQTYRDGLAALHPGFAALDGAARHAALDARPALKALAFEHGCEALYGDPGYGGNRDGIGWAAIGFDGQTQPRGWTDVEVTTPHGPNPHGAHHG